MCMETNILRSFVMLLSVQMPGVIFGDRSNSSVACIKPTHSCCIAFGESNWPALEPLIKRPEQRLSDIQTRLKRRLPSSPFNLKDDANLACLSNIVLQEADAIRLTTPSVTWVQLREAHERCVEADWEAHPPSADVDVGEWKEWDRSSLGYAVQSLCLLGVLHQGVQHTCPRCHHVVLVTIGACKEIRCDICGRTEAAPVNQPWDFRLNGFLRDALRSHGVGPLFWALD